MLIVVLVEIERCSGRCSPSTYSVVVVVVAVVLTLTHRYNADRGHRTGSNVAV